jgi:hypothetical protein
MAGYTLIKYQSNYSDLVDVDHIATCEFLTSPDSNGDNGVIEFSANKKGCLLLTKGATILTKVVIKKVVGMDLSDVDFTFLCASANSLMVNTQSSLLLGLIWLLVIYRNQSN